MKVDVEAIEQEFWPYGSNRDVYMIVDGARDRRIYSDLVNSHFTYSCLYSGDLPLELEAAAPHLVQLEFEDKYTRGLIQRAWGRSWGIFLKSETRMEKLRRHLRTFLRVRSYNGKILLFRYYDPRVLRVYLPTCTSDELQTVFGPIKHFWTEDESAESLLRFDVVRGKLQQERLAAIRAADVTGDGAAKSSK